jgi:hypothetical protein
MESVAIFDAEYNSKISLGVLLSERYFSGAARVATSPEEGGCVPGMPGCLSVRSASVPVF